MNKTIKAGRYRHYKGNDYKVIGVARHSETEEDLVLYFPLHGEADSSIVDKDYWVRPYTMFTESIIVEGIHVPRFKFIDEAED